MDKWNDRLVKAMNARGISQAELARYTKKSTATVSDWVNGISKMMTGDNSAMVCRLLRINIDWLYFGTHPSGLEDSTQKALIAGEEQREYEVRRVVPDRRDLDLINIPVLDVCASMGIGCLQPAHDDVISNITAHLNQLRRHASFSSPDNLALITGYGDSMEGTYNDGDLLLVDRGVLETKLDAVYVLALDGDIYIKRIQRRPNGDLLMISDNKKYEPYVIERSEIGTFQVLGRVVLAWNARKL